MRSTLYVTAQPGDTVSARPAPKVVCDPGVVFYVGDLTVFVTEEMAVTLAEALTRALVQIALAPAPPVAEQVMVVPDSGGLGEHERSAS